MSNYTITLKHKETGESHSIIAMDNYFGSRNYGYYIIPKDKTVDKGYLETFYHPLEEDEQLAKGDL